MEEILDLYDDNKKKTGKTIPRSKEQEICEGTHILIAALIAQNEKCEIMLQLTSKEKGNIYSLPSGHVLHNENSKDTIIRELYEEQGIRISNNDIRFLGARLASRIAYFDIYFVKKGFDVSDMILQKDEVQDVVWLKMRDIDELYKKKQIRKSSYEAIAEFLPEYK